MIGDFLPARLKGTDRPILLVGIEIAQMLGLAADEGGQLVQVNLDDVSIDWHYDGAEGKWTPDFPEG